MDFTKVVRFIHDEALAKVETALDTKDVNTAQTLNRAAREIGGQFSELDLQVGMMRESLNAGDLAQQIARVQYALDRLEISVVAVAKAAT